MIDKINKMVYNKDNEGRDDMVDADDLDKWLSRIVNIGTVLTWIWLLLPRRIKKKLRKPFKPGKHERR